MANREKSPAYYLRDVNLASRPEYQTADQRPINLDAPFRLGYEHWLRTIDAQVARGAITPTHRNGLIIRELTSRDKRISSLQTENAALTRIAGIDQKTQLPNPRAISTYLENVEKSGKYAGFVMMDIDHFKAVNDQHGHLAGDAILAEVGLRLSAVTRHDEDFIARFGGEEFFIGFSSINAEEQLWVRARQLQKVIGADPFVIESQGGIYIQQLTVSAGAAVHVPGTDINSTVHLADESLYAAKRAGRNRTFVYTGL